MIQSENKAQHFDVVADTAHMIMVVAQELSNLYKDSFINNERVELRRRHLAKYVDKLNQLIKRFDSEILQQDKVDKDNVLGIGQICEDGYVK